MPRGRARARRPRPSRRRGCARRPSRRCAGRDDRRSSPRCRGSRRSSGSTGPPRARGAPPARARSGPPGSSRGRCGTRCPAAASTASTASRSSRASLGLAEELRLRGRPRRGRAGAAAPRASPGSSRRRRGGGLPGRAPPPAFPGGSRSRRAARGARRRGRPIGASAGDWANARSVKCGCSRTRSHSPKPSGPGFSQIAFETPTRPRSCASAARRTARDRRRRKARRHAAASASSATPAECPRSHGDLRSVNAAIAANAASIRSPAIQTLRQRLVVERLLPDPRLVEPAEELVEVRDARARRARGSYAVPARRSTTARASSAPAAERKTERSRATCRSRAGSGIASPPTPPGNPWPSQRSKTNAERLRVPAPKPSQPANRCATSQCVAKSPGEREPEGQRPPRRIAARTSGGRPLPTCVDAGTPRPRPVAARRRARTRPAARCRRRRASPPRAASEVQPDEWSSAAVVGVAELLRRRAGELAQPDREHRRPQRVLERLARCRGRSRARGRRPPRRLGPGARRAPPGDASRLFLRAAALRRRRAGAEQARRPKHCRASSAEVGAGEWSSGSVTTGTTPGVERQAGEVGRRGCCSGRGRRLPRMQWSFAFPRAG